MAPRERDETMSSSVLSIDQQEAVEAKKVAIRMENEEYIRQHPELKEMIGGFMKVRFLPFPDALAQHTQTPLVAQAVLDQKPDDVPKFAASHFSRAPAEGGQE